MKVLIYNELNPEIIPGFAKLQKYLEEDDFKSADVKKVGDNLYRARLNIKDRMLISFYVHRGQTYALMLEFIKNHAYQNSRFLRQVSIIDEDKIPVIIKPEVCNESALAYLNPNHSSFNLLDKIISLDDRQQSIYGLQPPLIIIGSAGSGKTALTLEKMKQVEGDILYVTQSSYLVKNSRDLYYAYHYENTKQQVDFLSFQEFLESIQVPVGNPVSYQIFHKWFGYQSKGQLKDSHKLFEEFRGVITGTIIDKSYLSRQDYIKLGIKESIFLAEERESVYDVFEKYLVFLQEQNLYDTNLISFQHLELSSPRYDFVIIDEVQDLTNIQLYLIIKSLRQAQDFILCGDSNQIVHPNFFSWSKIKNLFYQQEDIQISGELIRILNTNYRNSPQVTDIANKVLKIKHLRFGSIDKESHYLVESTGHTQGEIFFFQDTAIIRQELDSKTKTSTLFAVIVMTDDQKFAAQQYFSTPLVFNIQEAKGLEYENIILYNFLSQEENRYIEISKGVFLADLELDIQYARSKDKADKSIEIYKFYINALYVAITRALKNIYWIESNPNQPLLELLNLHDTQTNLQLINQTSSLDVWQQESHKLALLGQQEQAERIRSEILKRKTPDWDVINTIRLAELKHKAFEAKNKDKKSLLTLFEYSLIYEDSDISNKLLLGGFKAALDRAKGLNFVQQKYYSLYSFKNTDDVFKQVDKYGPDFRNIFNQTPLMVAAWMGNVDAVKALLYLGADSEKVDNNGLTAFQIALAQMYRSETYGKNKLINIYELLKPTSINIQVDGHLIKLDKQKIEFLMINLIIALFYRKLNTSELSATQLFFNTEYFISAMQRMPNTIIPAHRRQRTYLSSILAKNSFNLDEKHNNKLFFRVRHGDYIFNPNLMVKVENKWTNIYDLLSIDKLSIQYVIHAGRGLIWHHKFQGEVKKIFESEEAEFKELEKTRQNMVEQFKNLILHLQN